MMFFSRCDDIKVLMKHVLHLYVSERDFASNKMEQDNLEKSSIFLKFLRVFSYFSCD